jgi:hypothetical protein
MVHYAQYPGQKMAVKMTAVNFDGVFGNTKLF